MDKVIVDQTAEALADEEAAFAAAMADDSAEVQTSTETTPEPEVAAQPEAEAPATEEVAETKPEGEPEQKLFAGKTEAEIQAMFDKLNGVEAAMSKLHDKAFGKIGEIQQKFEKLQATTFSPAAKVKLKEQFSELYDLLYDDAGDPLPVSGSDEKVVVSAPAPPEEKPADGGYTLEQQMELRLLRRDHPDWDKVMTSPEWMRFVESLDPTEREVTKNSWDADFMSGQLTKFKQAREAAQSNKAEATSKNKSRLAEAATPRSIPRGVGVATIEDDEEAAMSAGFNS